MDENLAVKNADTADLVRELRLRGFITYKRGRMWDRCRCICGHKAGELTMENGVYTLKCRRCGREYSGDSMEKAERAWHLGQMKEGYGW